MSLKTLTGEKSEELASVNEFIVFGISCGKEGPTERSFLAVEKKIATPKKIKKWR